MSEDIAAIAKGLTKAQRTSVCEGDAEKLEASVGTLLSLCLSDIADVRRDNSVFLTPLGLAVRAHLTAGDASSGMGGV